MLPLSYLDLYGLCEELQQLGGSRLQSVSQPSELRLNLEFWRAGSSRSVFLDLSPARPFVVSTEFTKSKTLVKKTPVYNFLRAHFIGRTLEKIEIAQKPNRTFLMGFGLHRNLIMKCFPHGQHLILESEEKFVNFPQRPFADEIEKLAFVEPENSSSWIRNEALSREASVLNPVTSDVGLKSSLDEKLQTLTKKLSALEKGLEEQRKIDSERIAGLEDQARQSRGHDLEKIYGEIKKLKKKGTVGETKRRDLLHQIDNLKSGESQAAPGRIHTQLSNEDKFSGTRVRISDQWEFWVGRNSWQNEDLLKRGSPHDLWFHLRDYPGAHGLLRGPKKSQPSPHQIETCGRIIAILSQTKKNPFREGEKLDVIVTPKKFVKKKKGQAEGRVFVERETVRRIAFKIINFEVIR